jgi:regulatory protein YycI of two-component signal transduction system YycFG
MNRTRIIFRVVFIFLTVMLLIYINRKSSDNTMSIVEFKYKTFKKIEADSLDTKRKLDLLVDETTKFIDDSSRVKNGVHYLTLLFVLQIIAEFVFLIISKKRFRDEAG